MINTNARSRSERLLVTLCCLIFLAAACVSLLPNAATPSSAADTTGGSCVTSFGTHTSAPLLSFDRAISAQFVAGGRQLATFCRTTGDRPTLTFSAAVVVLTGASVCPAKFAPLAVTYASSRYILQALDPASKQWVTLAQPRLARCGLYRVAPRPAPLAPAPAGCVTASGAHASAPLLSLDRAISVQFVAGGRQTATFCRAAGDRATLTFSLAVAGPSRASLCPASFTPPSVTYASSRYILQALDPASKQWATLAQPRLARCGLYRLAPRPAPPAPAPAGCVTASGPHASAPLLSPDRAISVQFVAGGRQTATFCRAAGDRATLTFSLAVAGPSKAGLCPATFTPLSAVYASSRYILQALDPASKRWVTLTQPRLARCGLYRIAPRHQ